MILTISLTHPMQKPMRLNALLHTVLALWTCELDTPKHSTYLNTLLIISTHCLCHSLSFICCHVTHMLLHVNFAKYHLRTQHVNTFSKNIWETRRAPTMAYCCCRCGMPTCDRMRVRCTTKPHAISKHYLIQSFTHSAPSAGIILSIKYARIYT